MRERGHNSNSLHKSAICAIMRQVPFDYDTMTRSICTHTHTRILSSTFLLPVSNCRRGHVARSRMGWGTLCQFE